MSVSITRRIVPAWPAANPESLDANGHTDPGLGEVEADRPDANTLPNVEPYLWHSVGQLRMNSQRTHDTRTLHTGNLREIRGG